MTLAQSLKHLRQHPTDALYVVQGRVRYWLYKHHPWVLSEKLKKQVLARYVLAQACYEAGSCRCCGCQTPVVFWASRPCHAGPGGPSHCRSDTPCYGPLI